jgi:hypothetical protein
VIIPIQSRAPGKKLDFTPLAFFRMRQHVYKNSPDHAVFARRAYREFAPVLNLSGRSSTAVGAGKRRHEVDTDDRALAHHLAKTPDVGKSGQAKFGFFGRRPSRQDSKVKEDNSSEKNLVVPSEDLGVGGIMVSQEVSIEERPASPISDDKRPGGIELTPLSKEPKVGVVGVVSKDEELPSYVDELFKTTVQSRTVH